MSTPSRIAMEERRLIAAAFFKAGCYQAEVARRLGVSRTTAGRWWHAWSEGGTDALALREPPGRPQAIPYKRILAMWVRMGRPRLTASALTDLIEEEFGLRYHSDHVLRIMDETGILKSQDRAPRMKAGCA